MKTKYIPPLKHGSPDNYGGRLGKKPSKALWEESSLIDRDRYYAFLKFRAQCNFRCEDFEMTAKDWAELWPEELYIQRGRSAESLCISRLDYDLPWHKDNVEVTTRRLHLQRVKTKRVES